jgi:MscS family membrane protein
VASAAGADPVPSEIMKVKFETLFRGYLLILALALLWGVWASAQTSTNTNSAPARSNPVASPLLEHLERVESAYFSFGLDRVRWLREHELLGEPVWKYAASLVYLLLAFYASRLIDLAARGGLMKLASKTRTRVDDLLIDLLRAPVKIVAFVILIHIGLTVFDWSITARQYLSRMLILVVAASLTWLATRVSGLLLEFWQRRVSHDDRRFKSNLFSFLGKSLNAFIIIVAVLVTAQNIGINMTAAIASLSIGGLAVGLAAQDTLANLFGAVAVLTDKPFQVGDQIKLDGTEGVVETIGLRSTRVRNPEGHLVAVPNKTMGNAIVTNITRRPAIKTTMNLVLARNLPAAKIRRAVAIAREVYSSSTMTEKAWVHFNQFAGGNVNILIVHWWKGTEYQPYLEGMEELNLAVKERFDAEGIAFA